MSASRAADALDEPGPTTPTRGHLTPGWGAGFGAVCAVVVVLLGLAVAHDWAPLLRLDAAIETPVHAWAARTPWVVDASRLLQTIGRFGVALWVVVATTVVLLLARRPRTALTLVLLASLAPLITDQVKDVVRRARPVWTDPLDLEPTYSYPSGHATAGIAVYAACGLALASLLRDRRWQLAVATPFVAVGVAIGVSRVVIGVHWTSDVVGGWCVALAVAGLLAAAILLPKGRVRDG